MEFSQLKSILKSLIRFVLVGIFPLTFLFISLI